MVICAFGLFKQREIEIPSLKFENGLWSAYYIYVLYEFGSIAPYGR